ncbi:MAG: glycosyltransferase [Pseudomonadota bacterium]
MAEPSVAAVVIGRNEGARLLSCLDSLAGQVDRIVYVDSDSTDGSVDAARAWGAEVVELDPGMPFTAARARNAGAAHLGGAAAFVQFVDGDCSVDPGWVATGLAVLQAQADVAVVCGRRRERHPDASVYNRLIDKEWDTPPGEARACGGDALMRLAAVDAVGRFTDWIIAGEEPELCVRLRAAGWRILRLDSEMTLHDASMTRLSQFWARARRAGYAFALGAALHGAPPERHYVRELRRALIWGAGLPAAAGALALAAPPWALLVLMLYPLQILRLWARDGDLAHAGLLTLAKVPEALGALSYGYDRLTGRAGRIIEYK